MEIRRDVAMSRAAVIWLAALNLFFLRNDEQYVKLLSNRTNKNIIKIPNICMFYNIFV